MNNLPAVDNLTVKKVQTGDSGAFKDLVGMLMQPAYFHALGLLGHHEDASDVVQQTLIRVWMNREKIDPERPFYPWFYTILKGLAFNHRRDRSRRNSYVIRNDNGQSENPGDTEFAAGRLAGSTTDWLEPAIHITPVDIYQKKEFIRYFPSPRIAVGTG